MISAAHETALVYNLYAEAFMYICIGMAVLLVAVNGFKMATRYR